MITNFITENYHSIDGEIRLSFMADTGIKDRDNEGYITVANARVLNAKAFYGANSSGKSNVFKAVGMMRGIVIHSVRLNDNEMLPYDAFLLSDKEARPTRLEMSFVDGTDMFIYGNTPVDEVVLKVSNKAYGYIVTKSLHESQSSVSTPMEDGYWQITLKVQNNYELRSLLRSFGEQIGVIAPESLRKMMKDSQMQ